MREPGGPEDPKADAREAASLFRGALLLLPLLSAALIAGFEISVLDAVFTACLLGTLPLLSMAQLPLLHAGVVERVPAYLGSVATLTGLGIVALLLGWAGPGLDALGLGGAGAGPWSSAWASSGWMTLGLLTLAVAVVAGAFHLAGRWLGLQESPLLRELIPRTGREKGLFVVLSLAAGIGEEVVYRGYLLAVLAPVFDGPWTAALVSSMAFAVLHAYQGPVGLVRSGLLGFLFAAAFIVHGSLWPVMGVHAGVDLVSGLLLGPRMLAAEEYPEHGPPHSTQEES